MATQDTCVSVAPYFKAHDGKLDAFKALCDQLVQMTSQETTALYCGFGFDGAQAVCREAYQNADAWLAHLQIVGGVFGEMLKVADLTRLEFHAPEQELVKVRKAIADMGLQAQLFTIGDGYRRA